MANQSIYNAFERMWEHIKVRLDGKSDKNHNHDDRYFTESEINDKLLPKSGGTITGPLTVSNTNSTDTNGLFISREGRAAEQVRHYVDDSIYHLVYTNDEITNSVKFEMTSTDTENGDGTKKSTSAVTLSNAGNKSNVTADFFTGALSGNASSASKVNNNLTIKLNGGTKEGTDLFTFNGSAAKSLNITASSIGAAASSHGTHVPSTCTVVIDWNSATATGWYMGSGASNAPTSGSSTWYMGYVVAHNRNYVYQELYQFTASTDAKAIPKYIRAKMNGTWGSWTNVTVAKAVPSNAVFTDNNTTYSNATQSAAGLMSSTDKTKLDGIATGANAYSHPTTSGNKHIPSGGSSGQILRWSADGTAVWGNDNNTTYSAATQSANGLMSAADKKKLDGIATGANAYSLPTASSSTLGGVKTTSTVTSTSGLTACPIISGVPYYKDTNTTYSLSSFGITATATELNYCDGVTSNIQTQLNGKADSGHTHNFIAKYNNNTINSPANDTTANWGQYGSSFHFYNTSGLINGQPSQYGFLQTYGYADEVYQLWMAQPGASMYIRGGNASGWGTGWKRLIDSSYLLNSVTTDSNDYVPTAATAKFLYDQINTKYGAGSQPNFSGISLGNGYPYIYTDNNNINFRWYWDNTYRYYSMEDIYQRLVYGAGSVQGSWGVTGSIVVSNTHYNVNSIVAYGNNNFVIDTADTGDGITIATSLRPTTDNQISCGSPSWRWTQLYAKTTTIGTSDRNQKKDFRTFDSNENYEKFFMDLKPTVFKYIDGESGRDHFGYISQDVEESLYKFGFNDKSFAGFCKDVLVEAVKDEDGNIEEVPVLDENGNEQYIYGLRYSEFISLNTYMIQKSINEINSLKEENQLLRKELQEIKNILNGKL